MSHSLLCGWSPVCVHFDTQLDFGSITVISLQHVGTQTRHSNCCSEMRLGRGAWHHQHTGQHTIATNTQLKCSNSNSHRLWHPPQMLLRSPAEVASGELIQVAVLNLLSHPATVLTPTVQELHTISTQEAAECVCHKTSSSAQALANSVLCTPSTCGPVLMSLQT